MTALLVVPPGEVGSVGRRAAFPLYTPKTPSQQPLVLRAGADETAGPQLAAEG